MRLDLKWSKKNPAVSFLNMTSRLFKKKLESIFRNVLFHACEMRLKRHHLLRRVQ